MSGTSFIRLPIALHMREPIVAASGPLDDEQFAVQQIEFIKLLFGYIAYLREHSRETPVADVFLSTFVNLLETMEANAPGEACGCVLKLQQIIGVVFPGAAAGGSSASHAAREPAAVDRSGDSGERAAQ